MSADFIHVCIPETVEGGEHTLVSDCFFVYAMLLSFSLFVPPLIFFIILFYPHTCILLLRLPPGNCFVFSPPLIFFFFFVLRICVFFFALFRFFLLFQICPPSQSIIHPSFLILPASEKCMKFAVTA